MLSSYRLGDLVLLDNLTKQEKNEILLDYPNSIGAEYIRLMEKPKDIKLVKNIMKRREYIIPEDIDRSIVIHLRLGDVVAGNEWHEKEKRPYDIDYYDSLLTGDKIYVIGKCFYAKTSSTNYDECERESNKYLEEVIKRYNAIHFKGEDADTDLCCGVRAKTFIKGKGFFSQLIEEIRKG